MLKPIPLFALITLGLLCSTTLVNAGGKGSKMPPPQLIEDREYSPNVRKILGFSKMHDEEKRHTTLEEKHLILWLENPKDLTLFACCIDPSTLPIIHSRVQKVLADISPLGSVTTERHPLIEAYKTLIIENEGLQEEFCRIVLESDQFDIYTVFLGVGCGIQSPNIRRVLQLVADETTFKSADFIELSKNPTQGALIRKHLLTLNWLAAINGVNSHPTLEEVNQIQCQYISHLIEKDELSEEEVEYILSQPYSSTFNDEIHHLIITLFTRLMHTLSSDRFDLDRLTQIARDHWQYYLILQKESPEPVRKGQSSHVSMKTYPECLPPFYDRLVEMHEQNGNHAKLVKTLDEMLCTYGKGNLYESLRIADRYFDAGEYKKTLEVLLENLEKTIDKTAEPLLPFFIQRLLIKAKARKLPSDVQETLDALNTQNWIELLKSEFKGGVDSLSIPIRSTYNQSTGAYLGVQTETIKLYEVNDLEAASAISKGDFASAIKWLKQRSETLVYLSAHRPPPGWQPVLPLVTEQFADLQKTWNLALQSRKSVEECLYAAFTAYLTVELKENETLANADVLMPDAAQLKEPELPMSDATQQKRNTDLSETDLLVSYLRNRLASRLIPKGGMFIKHLEKHYRLALDRLLVDHIDI